MSEIAKKFDIKNLFAQTQQTIEEAKEKIKLEASAPRIDRFRTSQDGEFNIRILPLAPVINEDGTIQPMDRKGYEYPIHQQFLKIAIPSKKKDGKPSFTTVPVINATDKGVDKSVDLIDEYVKMAKQLGDDDVTKKITSTGYEGGLRWQYQHAMYVLDLSKRSEGVKIYQISHSQYRDLEDAKISVWNDICEDMSEEERATVGCPISSFADAYQVRVKRSTENKKTSYTFTVNTVKKQVPLTEEELEKLLELPRIPEQIYRYTRYQMEATLEFLKQYDEKLQIDITGSEEFQAIVEKLKGELSADDTSHFDLSNANNGGDGKSKGGEVTLDSLWAEFDALADQEIDEKSDEYLELREKIRQFAEDNNYDIRISHSKTNEQLLQELDTIVKDAPIREAAADDSGKEDGDSKPEEKPAPSRRSHRPVEDDDKGENDDESEKAPAAPAPEPEAPAEEAAPIRRRRR